MARTPAQIGKANRRNGRDAERKVRDWLRPRGWPELDYTHAGGPTRAHADDRGDLAPCIDRDGDHWTIQVKGPRSQPSPGEVERWAAETAAQADANGRAAPTRPALDPRQGRGASNPWADTHPPRDPSPLYDRRGNPTGFLEVPKSCLCVSASSSSAGSGRGTGRCARCIVVLGRPAGTLTGRSPGRWPPRRRCAPSAAAHRHQLTR